MALSFGLCQGSSESAAHEIRAHDISFSCDVATVTGTFADPSPRSDRSESAAAGKHACIVIIGGTLSNTRDGGMGRDGVPQRDALKRLSDALSSAGFATLRYDKVGYGGSKATETWTGSYHDEAKLAAAAIESARRREDIEQVVAVGESAGAYVACLAAAAGVEADAYIFLGGHCGPGEAIYEYNFKRLAELARGDDAWRSTRVSSWPWVGTTPRCSPRPRQAGTVLSSSMAT
jgi:pimeloyl-ACP methyl ester carboxylesterase